MWVELIDLLFLLSCVLFSFKSQWWTTDDDDDGKTLKKRKGNSEAWAGAGFCLYWYDSYNGWKKIHLFFFLFFFNHHKSNDINNICASQNWDHFSFPFFHSVLEKGSVVLRWENCKPNWGRNQSPLSLFQFLSLSFLLFSCALALGCGSLSSFLFMGCQGRVGLVLDFGAVLLCAGFCLDLLAAGWAFHCSFFAPSLM